MERRYALIWRDNVANVRNLGKTQPPIRVTTSFP